jgi:mannosyltransferase OCH1-like enzyme
MWLTYKAETLPQEPYQLAKKWLEVNNDYIYHFYNDEKIT